MNWELIEKWIKALRSGEYKQAQGNLCEYDVRTGERLGYCCLGVLTHLVDPDHLTLRQVSQQHSASFGVWVSDDVRAPLYRTFRGRKISLPELKLASMNDKGKTFEEIADAIEAWMLRYRDS